MKTNISFLSASLLLCTILLVSCSEKKTQVTIFDGELQWPSVLNSQIMVGTNPDGSVAIWAPFFQTEIDNSLRGITLSMNTSQPGVYSGTYDADTRKWSNSAIGVLYMTIDYDGQPCPKWYARSATVNIQDYDMDAKLISATVEAHMELEGGTDTRNIRLEMQNVNVSGQN